MPKTYPAKRSKIAKARDAVVFVESAEDPAFVQRENRDCPECRLKIRIGSRVVDTPRGPIHSECANEGSR